MFFLSKQGKYQNIEWIVVSRHNIGFEIGSTCRERFRRLTDLYGIHAKKVVSSTYRRNFFFYKLKNSGKKIDDEFFELTLKFNGKL